MNELLDDNIDNGTGLSSASLQYLKETAKWGKFLAIVGFIGVTLIVILAIFAMTAMGAVLSQQLTGAAGAIGAVGLGLLYLGFALLYFFPIYYMYKFSTNMKLGIANTNQSLITEAFKNLKSCFKFMGIFTMVILCIYALIFLLGLVGGLAAIF